MRSDDNQKYVKFRSDIARLMILFNYGGIYFDLDIILLKDINCILDFEFCYQWGGKTGGNNAFLRLKKGSTNCNDIMNRYVVFPVVKKLPVLFIGKISTTNKKINGMV